MLLYHFSPSRTSLITYFTGEQSHMVAKNLQEPPKFNFHDGVSPNVASTLSPLSLCTLPPRRQAPHAMRPCRGSHLHCGAPDSVLWIGSLAWRVDLATQSGSHRVGLLLQQNPQSLRQHYWEVVRSLLYRFSDKNC